MQTLIGKSASELSQLAYQATIDPRVSPRDREAIVSAASAAYQAEKSGEVLHAAQAA